ncbi:Hypothetical predicted protein [Olea europaea subsp. europaea]|uniref:Uncharacterized protein n=1 Tax=Olea europaea subsp. europaea TaxID=158383 RepID=A0A8S0S9F5_OLEEU|nr:Hypothetical predicted protein [Olea europaea subsp. europaea]
MEALIVQVTQVAQMKHWEQLHVETQHALKWKEMAWVLCPSPEAIETKKAIKSVEVQCRVEVDLERAVGVEGSGSMIASGEVFRGTTNQLMEKMSHNYL